MVQFILLIVGIIYSNRRPKLKRMQASDFPDVPSEEFNKWKTHELISIDIFLWATWGLFILGILAGIFIGSIIPGGVIGLQIILIALFLLGLLVSAIYGSKAAQIQKNLGIDWPPQKLNVSCPNCGRRLKGVTTDMIGDTGVCAKCKTEFEINR